MMSYTYPSSSDDYEIHHESSCTSTSGFHTSNSTSTFATAQNEESSLECVSIDSPKGIEEEKSLDLDESDWCDEASLELNGLGFLLEDFFDDDFGKSADPCEITPNFQLEDSDVSSPNIVSSMEVDTEYCSTENSTPAAQDSPTRPRRPTSTILSILSPAELEEELQQTSAYLTEAMRRSELSRRQLNFQGASGMMLVQQSSGQPFLAISRDKLTSYIKDVVTSMTLG